MSNPANSFALIGNLARDLTVRDNKDGSKTVLGTIAVEDDFRSKGADGQSDYQVNYIPFRAYVSQTTAQSATNPWKRLVKGSPIALPVRLSAKPYTDANQQVQYPLTVEVDGFPKFLESKASGQARIDRVAAQHAAEGNNATAETAEQKAKRLERELAEAKAEAEQAAASESFGA